MHMMNISYPEEQTEVPESSEEKEMSPASADRGCFGNKALNGFEQSEGVR